MGASVAQLPGGEIVPAMERGVIDGFEFNNPTSDRRFGAQDVAKNYMLGSHHQATEYFEIMFKRSKFNALPAEHQAILQYAAEAVSSANEWKAMDYYSKDLQELIDQGQGQRRPHAAGRLRRPDQGLGRADRRARERSLHEEGDGLAEGVGTARRVLQHATTRPTTRAPSTITSRAC